MSERDHGRSDEQVGGLLLVLALLLLACRAAWGAPAPFARPGKDVAGAWRSGPAVRVTLGSDGRYAEYWHGVHFAGRWKADGDAIRVTCHPVLYPGEPPFVFRLVRRGAALEMEPYSTTLERVP